MSQTWAVGEIDPATTPPATDIVKITDGLASLKSQFSGASLPATNLVGGMVSLDTTNKVYWRRDPANSKWMLHASAADALVVAKSGAYTPVVGDFEKTLNCTGTWSLGLSAAATLTDGWWMCVINSGSGTITIDPNASETIDGAATLTLAAGDDCIVICDGSGFRTLRHAALGGSASQTFSVGTPTAPAHAVRADSIMRQNAIINGGCQVVTRPVQSLTTSPIYGPVDRFFSYYSGLTGVTATLNANTGWNENTLTGCGLWSAMSTTSGTGKVFQGQRIEAKNTRHFAGKTVTFRVKVFHDLGSTTNFTAIINKANAEDNFSAVTTVGTQITGDIPHNTWTYLTGTITLGSTDARNGLEVKLYNTNDIAWNGKSLHTSEWFLNDVSVAGVFEPRPYGIELWLCRRYLPAFNSDGTMSLFSGFGNASSTTQSLSFYPFKVPPRTKPTGITVSAGSHFSLTDGATPTACTAAAFNSSSLEGCDVLFTVASGLTQYRGYQSYANNASGQILFDGCEL